MAKAAGEAVYVKIRGMYHPDELVETAEETGILSRLEALLSHLNEDGQREALRRIEEMTYVPAYQNAQNR